MPSSSGPPPGRATQLRLPSIRASRRVADSLQLPASLSRRGALLLRASTSVRREFGARLFLFRGGRHLRAHADGALSERAATPARELLTDQGKQCRVNVIFEISVGAPMMRLSGSIDRAIWRTAASLPGRLMLGDCWR